MGGWLRYLALYAQSRTGFGSQIVVWLAVAAVTAFLAFAFLSVAIFVWLAQRYNALTAALLLTALFVLLAMVALLAAIIVRRRNRTRAKLQLAQRNTGLLDPRLLPLAMSVGRAVGWRRLLSLVAVAVLAAGVAKEWQARDDTQQPHDVPPTGG